MFNTRKLVMVLVAIALGLGMCVPVAQAAPISWGNVFEVFTDGDIVSGSVISAINGGPAGAADIDVTIGGTVVTFVSPDPGLYSGTNLGAGGIPEVASTGNAELDEVFDSHTWVGDEATLPIPFTMADLTPGQDYQVQIFSAVDGRSCCLDRTQTFQDTADGLGNISAPLGRSSDLTNSGARLANSVIGTFTADATEQSVWIMGDNDPGVSGYILTSGSPSTGIIIDGKFNDWQNVPVLIEDPADMLDPNGDYRGIRVVSQGKVLYNMQTVNGDANGTASPTYPPDPPGTERYYYHLMIDADNDLSTGWDNSEYEGNPTGVTDPMGVDYYVQIGRHSDKPDDDFNDGIEVYFLWVDEAGEVHDVVIAEDFDWQQGGDSQELAVTFDTFGVPDPLPEDWPEDVPEGVLAMLAELFVPGQTMKFAAFQEGNADGWATDFTQTAEYTFADVSEPLLGDVNLDEEVNGLDVDPFVSLVTSGTYQDEGDMNGDGEVNGLDVDPFVEAVVGGGVAAVPEPSALLLTLAALGILGAWRRKR